ncbi:MAG: tRNA 2-thiouridine(34) synthase MnmA [Anaerolineae bacterium]
MAQQRVVVAMSGGFHCSDAAALLVEQGYEVVGIMLRLWSELAPGLESTNRCCTIDAVDSARAVAHRLGIPFYLVNAEAQFRTAVVDRFIAEYGAGRTPNPCVVCNRTVRFGFLMDYARRLEAKFLATGHYARVTADDAGRMVLRRGVDETKDQSYVLHCLTQEQLRSVLFPLGEYTKVQVRALAAERGLPPAGRAESMDLCFAADGDYRRFLRDWAPETIAAGPIVNRQGQLLGRHRGLPFYTIGQRKGLGIAAPSPLYVLELRAADNTLVVGKAAELATECLSVEAVNWIAAVCRPSGEPPAAPFRAQVQVRYRAQPVWATVAPTATGASVRFEAAVRGAALGQSAVFYGGAQAHVDGEVCLGGGVIAAATCACEGVSHGG